MFSETNALASDVLAKVVAVIPAAGLGNRMTTAGGCPDKLQTVLVTGRPVLAEALIRIRDSGVCSHTILSVRPSARALIEKIILEYLPNFSYQFAPGGKTRQESVENALKLGKEADFYLVHDAARPCPSLDDIRAVTRKAKETGAAILVSKAVSTVKLLSSEGFIEKTLKRENVCLAETPQVFAKDTLLSAFRQAVDEGFVGTDESSLVERYGQKVSPVYSTVPNIKITTPEDIVFVNSILEGSFTSSL